MQIVTRASTVLVLLLSIITVARAQQVTANNAVTPRTVVTHQQLVSSQYTDLLDFVQRNRPEWLRTRGHTPAGAADIVVYVDGNRMGGRAALRSIANTIVAEVRFLDRHEATMRYGAGHGNGAVLVTTGVRSAAINAAGSARASG